MEVLLCFSWALMYILFLHNRNFCLDPPKKLLNIGMKSLKEQWKEKLDNINFTEGPNQLQLITGIVRRNI